MDDAERPKTQHGLSRRRALAAGAGVVAAGLAGCLGSAASDGGDDGGGSGSGSSNSNGSGDGPVAVASFFSFYDFARKIARDTPVEVRNLVPTGLHGHGWEPNASITREIIEADAFLHIGSDFQPWADRTIQTLEDDDVDGAGQWRTLDVAPALTDAPGPWLELAISQPIQDPMGLLDSLGPSDVLASGEDLTAKYGSDTEVLAVGVGRGNPLGSAATIDLFVDDLQVDGTTYDFPVANVSVVNDPLILGADGPVAATVELEGEWGGRTVEAIEGTATTGDLDGDGTQELRVEFPRSEVESTVVHGEGQRLTMAGVFEGNETTFSGTDEIEVTF